MATREQILEKLSGKLAQKHQNEIKWQSVVSAIGGSDVQTKAAIVQAIKKKDSRALSDIIFGLVGDEVDASAKAEAESMMSNDNLTLTDLQRIF